MEKIKQLFSNLQPAGIVTREKKIRVFITTFLGCVLLVVFVYPIVAKKFSFFSLPAPRSVSETIPSVSMPTIIDGKIVFPGQNKDLSYVENLGKKVNSNLTVLTADLVGLYEQSQNPKLTGIRILGETKNIGAQRVSQFKPIVKFIDSDGKTVTQKIGNYSESFSFYGLDPGETTLYDISVPLPAEQLTDKLEILFNSETATPSSSYENLKIADRNFEVKTASNSATGEQVEYYSVTGSVVNTFDDYLTDIIVAAWVKDKDGLVFSVGRQFFKEDLVSSGNKIDFKIPLLPLKNGFKYESYELRAWGKVFKLGQ